MVEDFDELSAVVTNPVERLSLKHFVRTYSSVAELPPSVSHESIEDKVVIHLTMLLSNV
jgi:hypothetical protein